MATNNTSSSNYVISIGRQYGSGGREIGRLVAQLLGIDYYDKELLTEAAKSSGMNSDFFEAADERSPRFFSSLVAFSTGYHGGSFLVSNTPISNDNIYRQQCEVISTLAERSSCVIMGRTADYVLRDNPNTISVFIHASIEQRIERIMARENCKSPEEARTLAEKKNKLRAEYYNFYTDKRWGDAQSYDLSVDSSKLGAEATARIIVQYVKARLGIE
ncbi:MAG: AAA family ATPase [Muribaculaceae bacterium]